MTYDSDIQQMADGYIEAALWADCEHMCTCETGDLSEAQYLHADDCEYRNESGGLQGLDVSDQVRAYIEALCAKFVDLAGADLIVFAELRAFEPIDGTIWEHIGHDLRLTSGGHGTGFWDRVIEVTNAVEGDQERFEQAREALTALAHTKPFDRSGGGDCFQVDDSTARFEHYPIDTKEMA